MLASMPLFEHAKEEGIQTVCRTYETVYVNKPSPTSLLEQSLRLLAPVRLKKLPPNIWLKRGHKGGSSICEHLYE